LNEYRGFSGFPGALAYFHPMSEGTKLFHVKRSLFSAPRQVTIAPLYLEMEGPLANTRFTKEDIEGLRFGVTLIRYYLIPLSKSYNIEVKSSQGKIITIRMHTFLGIGSRKIRSLFIGIHKQIQQSFFNDMAIHYVRLLNGGLTFELGGAFLTSEGVLIKKDKQLIPWLRTGLATRFHACSIYDTSDLRHFRSFDYWHDWNASLLRSVVDYKIRAMRS
jgi:hypothetical protein